MDKVKILARYMPEEAAPIIGRWIDHFKCDFKISRGRTTKFGDYRAPHNGSHHRISVNYNLNPYAFLLTTVHEFAHLLTWEEHKHRVKPHGQEWKGNFRKMMQPFLNSSMFPAELHQVISEYLLNPAASSCSDPSLFRSLMKYNPDRGLSTVEDLPMNSCFRMTDGRVFRKEALRRKRYLCTQLSDGKSYLFNPLAEVFPLAD